MPTARPPLRELTGIAQWPLVYKGDLQKRCLNAEDSEVNIFEYLTRHHHHSPRLSTSQSPNNNPPSHHQPITTRPDQPKMTPPIPTRRLGPSGPLIPALGLGLMGLSGVYGAPEYASPFLPNFPRNLTRPPHTDPTPPASLSSRAPTPWASPSGTPPRPTATPSSSWASGSRPTPHGAPRSSLRPSSGSRQIRRREGSKLIPRRRIAVSSARRVSGGLGRGGLICTMCIAWTGGRRWRRRWGSWFG